jgi:ferredoxin
VSENCIGCGYCIAGCPFNVPRISKKDNKAYKCSLCSDRVAVGLSRRPASRPARPALMFGAKNDMVARGAKRVNDLRERGLVQAALYDPQGVGGTHVMYVLQHGDRPDLYSGLPVDPKISPWVSCGKGSPSRCCRSASAWRCWARSSTTSPGVRRKKNREARHEQPRAMKSGDVPRYNANERVTHWVVAITFVLLAASGLAFFHPAFWFLTSLLGGGAWARILHPFIGVVMFVPSSR